MKNPYLANNILNNERQNFSPILRIREKYLFSSLVVTEPSQYKRRERDGRGEGMGEGRGKEGQKEEGREEGRREGREGTKNMQIYDWKG